MPALSLRIPGHFIFNRCGQWGYQCMQISLTEKVNNFCLKGFASPRIYVVPGKTFVDVCGLVISLVRITPGCTVHSIWRPFADIIVGSRFCNWWPRRSGSWCPSTTGSGAVLVFGLPRSPTTFRLTSAYFRGKSKRVIGKVA